VVFDYYAGAGSAKLKTASASLMDATIVYSCGGFCSAEKADEIEAFFEANKLPSNQRKISQVCTVSWGFVLPLKGSSSFVSPMY
jgi:hypothetical protein